MVICISQPVAPENVQVLWVAGWPEVVTAPVGGCSSCSGATIFVPEWSHPGQSSSASSDASLITPIWPQSEQSSAALSDASLITPTWTQSEQPVPDASVSELNSEAAVFTPAWSESGEPAASGQALVTPIWSQPEQSASASYGSQAFFAAVWPQPDPSFPASCFGAFVPPSWPQPEQAVSASSCGGAGVVAPAWPQPQSLVDPSERSRSSSDVGQATRSNALTRRRRRQRAAKPGEQAASVETVGISASTRWADIVDEEDDEEQECVDMNATPIQESAMWIMAQLEADDDARNSMIWRVHEFALADQSSCRALQLVLESVSTKDAVALSLGFQGYVQEAIASRLGNYVIQKIIEVTPAATFSFIADELLNMGAAVARHRFGCRVLCRLLEHLSSDNGQTCLLVDEVLKDAEALCRHHYGNYVVQHILEFGSPEQKRQVACALCSSMAGNARNKNASRTIEKALAHCCLEDRSAMLNSLLSERSGLPSLAEHQFGSFVVQAVLRLPQEQSSQVVALLRPFTARLKSTRYGRRVAEQLNQSVGKA